MLNRMQQSLLLLRLYFIARYVQSFLSGRGYLPCFHARPTELTMALWQKEEKKTEEKTMR